MMSGGKDSRYVIEEEVARGGMGVIYRVIDRSLDRTVAMKVSASAGEDSGESAALRARFLEEAKVTARLDHPGIVPVHELGVSDDDQPYFTMHLVRGRSLGEVFGLASRGEEGWNLSRAIAALIKVCQAVAYAHSKGIVHRDLKPANVMVGRFGEVYVLDWGLAKVLGEDRKAALAEPTPADPVPADPTAALSARESSPLSTSRIPSSKSMNTEHGVVLGTPVYMAPEQAQGRNDEVDARSDVYSLGAILYELLAGEPPYLSPGAVVSPAIILAQAARGPPRPVRALNPRAPAELVAVCEKAMARDRSQRYSSAFDLSEDLQAFLDHRVVTAYRTGVFATLRAWCLRHRALLRAVGLVAVVMVVALVGFYRVARTREAERLIESARTHLERYREVAASAPELTATLIAVRKDHANSTPSWYRDDELNARRSLNEARREHDSRFNSAVADLSNAARIALGAELRDLARGQLAELYFSRYRDIESGEGIVLSSEYYRRQIEDLDVEGYREAIEKPSRIAVRSVPAGAEVFCFRHEESEDTRLEPRPYDPAARRSIGAPLLRVASIEDPECHQRVFAVGDRLLELRGRAVRTLRDLALAIEGLQVDEKIEVHLERRGSRLQRAWAPFPSSSTSRLKPGRLEVVHEQLGLTFEGYPLDFLEPCRLGETTDGKPLTFELSKGSYLLVFRKSGYRDVRYPVVVPRRDGIDTVTLFREKDIPEGFVHVSAGPFSYGGDPHAFQSLEPGGNTDLPGFFIARFEVTIGQYLEFLNDLDTTAGIDSKGAIEPRTSEVKEKLANLDDVQEIEKVVVVPAMTTGELLFERRSFLIFNSILITRVPTVGAWAVKPDLADRLRPTTPVSSVSQLAALEYAHWRGLKDGGRKYRLPTDLEWEKAARGVDRRTHVWGDYLIWSFCWSARALSSPRFPPSVGLFSADDSVYGVRDLAGSMAEHTSSKIRGGFVSRRGGNWNQSDSQDLRAATRNGRLSNGRGTETGFRLVVDLPQRP